MTLPFYPFYWGDYSAKTFALTMGQHGAYTLLLRHIYCTGQRIPHASRFAIAKASTRQEKEDVDLVLVEYFSAEGEFWFHRRAEEVMKDAEEKHQLFVESGKRGGRPKKSPPYSPPFSEEKPPHKQPEPEPNKEERKNLTVLSKEKTKSNFPDYFSLDMTSQKVADSLGLTDNQVLFEIEAMRDWAVNAGAKGRRKDWQAFARTWFRNNKRKPNGKNSSHTIKGGLELIESAISSEHFNRRTPVCDGDGEADFEVVPRLRQIYP